MNLIFPVSCVGCGASGTDLCDVCLNDFKPAEPDLPAWITSVWTYRDPRIRNIILHLKTLPNTRLTDRLAEPIMRELLADLKQKPIILQHPIIVPVPVTRTRFMERGYNQALVIAQSVARHCHHSRLRSDILVKPHDTQKQSTLHDKNLRMQNAVGIFAVKNSHDIVGRDILIIDDVTTTTATLSAARDALIAAGARTVHALTIAH